LADNAPRASEAKSAAGLTPAPPCTIVIFGAHGDLTKRLLAPAIYDLATARLLNEKTAIIGVDHLDGDDGAWAAFLRETVQDFVKSQAEQFGSDRLDDGLWDWLRERMSYFKADFEDDAAFAALAKRVQGAAVFYLAVSPRFFEPIAKKLGSSGLMNEGAGAFRRLIIEKPFGADLASAKALNKTLLSVGSESQIFRVDHFLGKDVVQSLMAVRFANRMYEPMWRAEHIDYVEISAGETLGVEERGAFYEATGALRDMVPNHLFQLLCMVAMEPPESLDAEAVRTQKTKLLQAIAPIRAEDAVRGQYGAGQADGKARPAYRQEPHVAPDSRTETYAAVRLTIENDRWRGVPFYLRTGKRLATKRTEIVLHFKAPTSGLFRAADGGTAADVLRLLIDPEHGATTRFNVKVPGPKMTLAAVENVFRYSAAFPQRPNVGYETLLYDCMIGDATLFQRADNIESGWAAVQPILDAWRTGDPELYPSGSDGPAGADALLAKDGKAWSPLAKK
jgi:glucose-6-phosphate 1-dehydrogenase